MVDGRPVTDFALGPGALGYASALDKLQSKDILKLRIGIFITLKGFIY